MEPNSTAFEQGLRQGQIIIGINGNTIETLADFSAALEGKFTENQSIKMIFETKESEIIFFSDALPEITVSDVPKTNIKTGLDLSGGSRALIQAKDVDLTASELADLIDVVSNRLDVYGITDMNIVPVTDLSGNSFILIEIAGTTPKDLEDLISKQGKFEAIIGNETAFVGGDKDVASVCRNDAACAGIESCKPSSDGYYCNFRFSVFLSEEAAKRHADITRDLEINVSSGGRYLSEKLDLFVDDSLLSSLFIGEGLRGRVTTQISISGSGQGTTRDDAYDSARDEMNRLQTILITGSLPYKLEVVKLDTISPVLGQEFISSILLAGLAALMAVALVVFIRYRKIKSSLALVITSISEVIIILCIASFIEWNLDLPSIAGIIAGVGTGIDSQIIVLDEARQGDGLSIKQRLKRAFSIILGAYFTALVALLPLMWAGAGLLKGFAITTLIGITVGVLITRPAFADMIRLIEE